MCSLVVAWEYKLDQRFTLRESRPGVIVSSSTPLMYTTRSALGCGRSLLHRWSGSRHSRQRSILTTVGTGGWTACYGQLRRRSQPRLCRSQTALRSAAHPRLRSRTPYAGALTLWDRLGGDFMVPSDVGTGRCTDRCSSCTVPRPARAASVRRPPMESLLQLVSPAEPHHLPADEQPRGPVSFSLWGPLLGIRQRATSFCHGHSW
jgi:hypothetical protein